MNLGGCTVSKSLYERRGRLKWCVRDKSKHEVDTGWLFFSDIDTEEDLHHAENFCICRYETVIEIEPAVLFIYDFPIGTDLMFVEDGRRFFIDNKTGEEVKLFSDEELV